MGAILWNELPIALRTSPSKFTFKKSLKLHFLNVLDILIFDTLHVLFCYLKKKGGDVVITYVVSTGVKENRESNYEKRASEHVVSQLHIPL